MNNKLIIVNMGAYGDILNTTPIAKHYKTINPDIKISWLTRKKYISVLKNNKYIDKIIVAEETENTDNLKLTRDYFNFFKEKNTEAKFVAPYIPLLLKTGKIQPARSSLLQIIKYETSGIDEFACDFIPNVFLSSYEIEEARSFFSQLKGNKKILFEYETFSQQSPFNEQYFDILCERLNNKNIDLIFTGLNFPIFLTEERKLKYNINFILYNGSFMSNAELYNLCDGFIGTSSGISCLTHSDYCDINKPRIEVCFGYHWSTFDWTHMKNKKVVFYLKQFKEALAEYI